MKTIPTGWAKRITNIAEAELIRVIEQKEQVAEPKLSNTETTKILQLIQIIKELE